jgi:asparagine synthase (glutamine-hydrolysing)
MTQAIVHRGPDADGYWFAPDASVGLGHRRLSILDLSPAGAQPMVSPSGRYAIAFNGEIYNHLKLRAALGDAAVSWRGHSDTETLLAGFDAWGIEEAVERSVGMFAFAVWDRESQVLTLARDRMGEKPVYYGWQGAVFLFGSELKALRAHPAFRAQIDRNAVALFMRYNHVPGSHCIYRDLHKLEPGCLLQVSLAEREPRIDRYWSLADVALQGISQPFTGSDSEAVDALEALLKDAVGQQMVADVPLGAFLSGGVDSSAIVALMQAQASRPVRTFSIGFHEDAYNEAEYAKAVARHLETDHTDLYVTPQEAMAVIPRLPVLYDEPFADSSQIPTFLVSGMARRHVTVSLSGDAGDELFAGYNRHEFAAAQWPLLQRVPRAMRAFAASALEKMPLPGLASRRIRAAALLRAESAAMLYRMAVSNWDDSAQAVLSACEPETLITSPPQALTSLNATEQVMALDQLTYLPDDILVKVDRAAMGVSLETRVPLLDHRIVEFAWSLPQDMKLRRERGHYTTKWALRQVLYRHVPKGLIERPKMGFSMPVADWLRGPLRDWAEALLSPERLAREGFLNSKVVRWAWGQLLRGNSAQQNRVWLVLMFQSWLEKYNKNN